MPPATIWRINAILSAACNYAITWGWIDRNPAALAHKPKLKKKRARPQSAEQVAALINLAFETDFEFGVFLWLAATTGARRGELCGLLWKHIDLEHGLIVLEENFIVRSGQRIRKPPKTDEVRPLSLDDFAVVLLTDLKASKRETLARLSVQLRPEASVFSPEIDGSIEWNPDTFTHKYEKLARRIGIEEPLKNLRHFNATQLMSGGIDLSTVAGRLGHADGGVTTLRFYADWIRPADKRAAELVSQGLTDLRERLLVGQSELDDATPSGPVSKVAPVVAALMAAIESGELAPGAKLPTLKALSEAHGVSYGTAQLAVAQLRAAGLVAVERGRSAVVLAAVPD
jgi:integrase